MSTDSIADATFKVSQGFATSSGRKLVNANLYSKGVVINTPLKG